MRPDPERTGETFRAFVSMLSNDLPATHPALKEVCEFLSIPADGEQARALVNGLGYSIDYRELRACDFGAPTIRKRFFMVMRCDGRKICWPAPTHGDPKSPEVQGGRLAPWRTAAECINWSIPCPSIFERKRALADNTLRRIARRIQRFVIDNPSPFIVKCNHTSTKSTYDCFRGQSLDEPIQTITKTHGFAIVAQHMLCNSNHACLVAPVIARQFGNSIGHGVDEPNGTVTAGGGGKSQLVATFLAKHFGGNYTGCGADLAKPAHTVTTVDHHALVTSNLVKMRGTNTGQQVREPLQTVTAGGNHFGEVRTFLVKYYGNEKEGVSLIDPLHTVSTTDRFGLVSVEGIDYQIVDIGMRMLQPHQLYAAQGFPDGYIINQDYRGIKYAKDKQVAQCGNAVPPPFAEALVRANLPEVCSGSKGVAA